MWHKTAKVLLTAVMLVSSGALAAAQSPAGDTDIVKLRELIGKLEAVDRDPSTPAEVKTLNRGFLESRRAQLRALVRRQLDALRSYQATIGPSLSADERAQLERSIRVLSGEAEGTGTTAARRETQPPPAPAEATGSDGASGAAVAVTPEGTDARQLAASNLTAAATPSALATVPQPTPTPTLVTPEVLNCSLYQRDPKAFSWVDKYTCSVAANAKVHKVGDPRRGIAPNNFVTFLDESFDRLLIILAAKKGRAEEFLRAEHARVDKQIGAESSNAGTTSLVSKGNIPAILGFAVENGALEREVDGTSVTFRVNPVGLFKTMEGQGIIGGYDTDDNLTRFLRRFGLGVTFNTDRGDTPGFFTGRRQQLSSVNARAVLYDKRDPRRAEYKKDWEDFLATRALNLDRVREVTFTALVDDVTNPAVPVWKDPALERWYRETVGALAGAEDSEVEAVLVRRLNELPLDDLSPDTVTALANFEREFSIFLRDRNAVLKKVGRAGVLTFDYVNERNVDAPNLSKFRLIGEKGFRNGRLDLTGNAAFTIFDTKPTAAGVGRMRDAQAALQLDGTFGRPEAFGVFVLSFAYKYERLMEDAVVATGVTVPDTKGDINTGQLKLTIPVKPLGLRIPISVTFANRTELIKEKEVRGNFGFTFDLDQILGKLKPF